MKNKQIDEVKSKLDKKKKFLTDLKKLAKDKKMIYLATDPDREGEAISWHLKERIGGKAEFKRVVFHEITKEAVAEAFKKPADLDLNKVNAQTGRRVLDRLVGYLLSPNMRLSLKRKSF